MNPNYLPHPLAPLGKSVMRFNDDAGKWEMWDQWHGGAWVRGGGSSYLPFNLVVSFEDTWAEPLVDTRLDEQTMIAEAVASAALDRFAPGEGGARTVNRSV